METEEAGWVMLASGAGSYIAAQEAAKKGEIPMIVGAWGFTGGILGGAAYLILKKIFTS